MTTYKDAGVDTAAGDAASKAAYARAAVTFPSRAGMIGAPVEEADGYAGLLDMGDFYMVQTTDGTGTKMDIAARMGRYDSLGYDLLAMVADDAVCTGAEVISVSNCIDVPKVDPKMIDTLLGGLAKACQAQRIVIPAGEIAEVPGTVAHAVWSATAVGVVAKDRVMDVDLMQPGDVVLAIREHGARCNGFSLIRKILTDAVGNDWQKKKTANGKNWGEAVLTPSVVYHDAVLRLLGRYGEKRPVNVRGIAHITGGGIPSKFRRILKKKNLGAELTDLWEPPAFLSELIGLGSVAPEEAYRTWSMGNGMLLVLPEKEVESALRLLKKTSVEAKRAGVITADSKIIIKSGSASLSF
ncbi:MAG TPA: AIR synthase-related protein [Candidatus Peribacteraceae bacterium]|nr:AIR synthase-related protein [Candidatus Peribacteraceae bacterium]